MSLITLSEETYALVYQTDQQLVELSEMVYRQTLEILAHKPALDGLKDSREKAKAIEAWLLPKMHSRDAKIEARNNLSESIIRIERELGKWLLDVQKNQGERGQFMGGQSNLPPVEPPTLADMSISKYHSSKWQAMAALPAEKLEEQIAETRENGWELTSTAIEKHGRAYLDGSTVGGHWEKINEIELSEYHGQVGLYKSVVSQWITQEKSE